MFRPRWFLLLLAWSIVQVSLLAAEEAKPEQQFAAADLEFFENKVRPILSSRCWECHDSKQAEPKGGLRLDSYADVLKGGDTGPAVVPKNLEKSLLIDSIRYGELYQMPPKGKLPAAEIAILEDWVKRGAPWPAEAATATTGHKFDLLARKAEHWCWQAITNPTPSNVKNADWPLDPLDRFVLAKLEAKNLTPQPVAERAALIRRAQYDLHGMQAAPLGAAGQKFLETGSSADWAKFIDELLAAPQYGEHMTRRWLDLVRYAETYGHEFDYEIPQAWQYRDYLIRAFNADVPFDQLTREHLAGDLLEQPRLHPTQGTNESILGTGFFFLGEQTHSPVDLRAFTNDRIDNMVDVVGKTFLGLTVACARCHDHKFDAISTADYYAMTGILRSTREQIGYLDPQQNAERSAAEIAQHVSLMQQKQVEYWSQMPVESAVDLAKELELVLSLKAKAKPDEVKQAAQEKQLDPERILRWQQALKDDRVKSTLHPAWFARRVLEGADPLPQFDQQLAAPQPVTYRLPGAELPSAWSFTGQAWTAQSTSTGETVGGPDKSQYLVPRTWDTRRLHVDYAGVLRSPNFTVPADGKIQLLLAGTPNTQVRVIIEGYRMDQFNALIFRDLIKHPKQTDLHWVTIEGDLKKYAGLTAFLEFTDPGQGWLAISQFRVSDQVAKQLELIPINELEEVAELLMIKFERSSLQGAEGWSKRYQKSLNSTFSAAREKRLTGARWELFAWLEQYQLLPLEAKAKEKLTQDLQTHQQAIEQIWTKMRPQQQPILAAVDHPGRDYPVLIRGNSKTPGTLAPRQILTALQQPNAKSYSADSSGRWELAQDITRVDNPLFSRVLVNRLWQQLFDRGIVATVDNFGVLGMTPTHPELLDHLAISFQQDGYSIKRMLRRIMLSRTYQLSSQRTAALQQADPNNDLLASQRLKRMSGEAIHDTLLNLGGNFNAQMFGPPVPIHLTTFMEGRGRPGKSGPLDNQGRRMIYQSVRRNFLSPLALAFDTPIPFNTVGRRNQSNVPAQALILMNDPFVKNQTQLWAKKILANQQLTLQQRIEQMLRQVWGRDPDLTEIALAEEFLLKQVAALNIPAGELTKNVELWSDLAQALINSKEFLFVP